MIYYSVKGSSSRPSASLRCARTDYLMQSRDCHCLSPIHHFTL
jgi:hypothetical protein